MDNLNNSFPAYFEQDKFFRDYDVTMEERNNLSAFNLDFIKFNENLENMNKDLSPQKKHSIELSYFIEQTFCDNLQMNIEEEFNNEDTFLKIGNEGQKSCIDPIHEVDSFEVENESFLHENKYLFHSLNNEENTNSFEINSTLPPYEFNIKFDSIIEESEIRKIRKNIMSIKASKSCNTNTSEILNDKKKVFIVHNLTNTNITNNNSINNLNKLNQSCNLSCIYPTDKKRGRKKLLFDGIKTEIIDKAFLREFKAFLKKSKCLKSIYDDLKHDEKTFWNDFLQTNSPPFIFTSNNNRLEYKSYSKNLLKHLFSFPSMRNLYNQFFKEKGKEIINSIVNKKIKKVDRKVILFYTLYGKNMHKLYSNEIFNEFNIDEISENIISTSGILSTYDSINLSV